MEREEEDKRNERPADISEYLRDEARAHVRHWKDIKRETDRMYSEMEEATSKLVLSAKEIVTEDKLSSIMDRNRKVQLLNLEAVKVNARLLFIMQLAASFGIDLKLDTTYDDKSREILRDKSSGFMFHEEGGRLRYNDPEVEAMLSDVSLREVKRIGVQAMYDSLVAQYKDFKGQVKDGLSNSLDKN